MVKRRASLADAPSPSKQSRRTEPILVIISSLSAKGKIAIARCILKELQSSTLLVSDPEIGRLATPKQGLFEVKEYTTETPQLPPDAHHHVVVVSHDLARPTRIAEAMATDGNQAQLVTVVDARTFLDVCHAGLESQSSRPGPATHTFEPRLG